MTQHTQADDGGLSDEEDCESLLTSDKAYSSTAEDGEGDSPAPATLRVEKPKQHHRVVVASGGVLYCDSQHCYFRVTSY